MSRECIYRLRKTRRLVSFCPFVSANVVLNGWAPNIRKWFVNNLGEPNIKPSRNDFVYGSVYLLSESDVEKSPDDGAFSKTTMTVDFIGPKGRKRSLPATVFVDGHNVYDGWLSQGYIDSLNQGIVDSFTGSHDYYVDKYLRPYVPEAASVPM